MKMRKMFIEVKIVSHQEKLQNFRKFVRDAPLTLVNKKTQHNMSHAFFLKNFRNHKNML